MRLILKTLLVNVMVVCAGINANAQSKQFKCLLQMSNYVGEGAYIVVSLIDSKDAYEKTLYVMGSDKKWYKSIDEWYKFYANKQPKLSAITGASVTGGDRSITTIEIETSKIDAGYKLRFESAVESKKYYVKDVEVPLTTQALSSKTEGTGYIRYVRFTAN